MASLASIAEDTDRRAEAMEDDLRRLALLLFALELGIVSRALARAQTDAEVLDVLRAAQISYRAPNGLFRRRWENGFGELLRDLAAREARRALPVLTGPARVPGLPSSAFRAIDTQATELAASVTRASAVKLEAAARAVVREISDRRTGTPPPPPSSPPPPPPGGGPPLRLEARRGFFDQRLETLIPLVGREAAEEIMRVVRAGREGGQSISKLATALTEQIHATEITKIRATRIARTESIGLVNLTEFERAKETGVLREKRWLSQRDGRVRESHVIADQEGWIPIDQRCAGSGLLYPGERPSPPEQTANCRCAMAFRA